MFKKNVKKMVISSMAQDIIQRGADASELDTINGYLLDLAKKHGAPAPYNQAIYDLCVREFGKDKFEPMDPADVWAYVSKQLP
jgi:ketopantoate reductase